MIDNPPKNKYERWYRDIIDRARTRVLSEYHEEHHIRPKSIYGEGPTVQLTAREHFIVHWLLVKMTNGDDRRKMQYAFNCMATTRDRKLTAVQYQAARKALSDALKVDTERGNKISMKKSGKKFTEEHKAALREAAKTRKPQSEEANRKRIESMKKAHAEGRHAGMTGKKQTEHQKKIVSERHRGKSLSEEHRAKISAANSNKPGSRLGTKNSPETRAKMAEARRRWWAEKRVAAG